MLSSLSLKQPGTAVAVSGGQDSLLALALLRQAGQRLMAVHAFLAQTTPDHILDRLRENCRTLEVDLQIADLRKEFDRLVISPYVRAYLDGSTPNPCAWCNVQVKFGLLLEHVQSLGARSLATGHYAQIRQDNAGPQLWRAEDQAKDQSYFLALLTPDQLRHAAFPLARRRKKDVLARLEELGLSPPTTEESQEVCFIPGDYRDFLTTRARPAAAPGPIVLPDGTRVGTHQGLWNYTIGQRRGLNISWSEPLYVSAKIRHDNRLVVAPRNGLQGGCCVLERINLLAPVQDWPDNVFVQTRYRQQPLAIPAARILESWPGLELPQTAEPAAPGQLAVIYSSQGRVLAGAVIAENR